MADSKFFTNHGPFKLDYLVKAVGATLSEHADPSLVIRDIQALDRANVGELSFLSNPKYVNDFKTSNAAACVVSQDYSELAPREMALVLSDNPYKTFAKISNLFYPEKPSTGVIHATALISTSAKIGANVSIGAYTVIEEGVCIGDNSQIGSQCFIGENCFLGADSNLHAQVTVKCAEIGDHVTLYSGARIGEDGFGFAPDPTGHIKIPQLGRVIIGNNVEIGANTTIDRGAGPDTIIGEGCWIDNLCQIAHNVKLGRGCILASQTGISGSTTLEDFVVLGGQVGLAGHIRIGMGTQISAKSGVISDVSAGQIYAGFPARPRRDFFKSIAILNRMVKGKGRNK